MQKTHSSLAIFLRAVIMIAFLTAIPVIALFGNTLPDKARDLIAECCPKLQEWLDSGVKTTKYTCQMGVSPEASPYSGVSAKEIRPVGTVNLTNSTPDRGVSIPPAILATKIDPSPRLLPSQTTPAGAKLDPEVTGVQYQAGLNDPATSRVETLSPVQPNSFLQIQERLKKLGATYYLLETWGNQQELFRFYCQVAVMGNTSYTRCFETTNADPLRAMSDVLQQVETWRSGNAAVQ